MKRISLISTLIVVCFLLSALCLSVVAIADAAYTTNTVDPSFTVTASVHGYKEGTTYRHGRAIIRVDENGDAPYSRLWVTSRLYAVKDGAPTRVDAGEVTDYVLMMNNHVSTDVYTFTNQNVTSVFGNFTAVGADGLSYNPPNPFLN